MREAIYIYRGDRCPICKNDRCLELYDNKNEPLSYSYIIDMKRYDKLNDKNVTYMRCKKCNKEFRILWNFNNINPILRPSYITYDQFICYAIIRSNNNYKSLKDLNKIEKGDNLCYQEVK